MAQNATEKGGGPSLSSTDSVVSCNGLRLSYGNHAVLDDATIAVHEGEKIGVVGRNGSGKSSFLKILSGAERPDGGDIARKSNLVTGYLSQEFTLREEATVLDNVRDGAADVLTLIHRYENAADLSPTEAQRIHDQIDAADGWTLETHLETVMQALDCPSIDRRVDSLSGGEKRRVALCRALAGRPDLLVLDEPTNHLDAESILWLEGYLVSFRGAVVFVTHDRYFLDRIATRIAELDLGKFFTHEGNYSDYLEARAERQAVSRNAETRRQSFLRRELQWVRAGVKARTTKARSRLDSYYRIAEKDAPEQELDMDLILPKPPPLGNIVVDLENVGAVLGGKRLFAHFNMKFEPGRKIGIVGRNGLGKTTLLRILMGEMEPTEGRVSIGKKTVFNYVDQNRVSLDESRSILDEVGEGSEFVQFGAEKLSVRGYLRRFLFTDERLTERIGILSGGEKNRVLLAKILRNGGNFLVLDEPTNDLDLQTLRVLEEALLAFQGVVVVVSHDRYFLDRVADQTIAFEGDGVVTVNEGGWSYYLEKRQQRLAAQSARAKTQTPAKVSAAPDKPTSESRERPRKLSWKEERELEGIEPAIEKGEAKAAELEALLHDPDFYRENAARVPEVTAELETLRAELERLYTRWQELESVRAAAETR